VLSSAVHAALTVIIWVVFLSGMGAIGFAPRRQPPHDEAPRERDLENRDSEPPDLTLAA
jgi:hypothetical protein